jgi:pimeloyl-ACP methyl ester carboxylesterase
MKSKELEMRRQGPIYRGETRYLDHDARSSAPAKSTELSDAMVHYELDGPPDAQRIVLGPGFSVPYSIWDPTFHALIEAGFQVLRYGLFGREYSDRPDICYDLDYSTSSS